MGQSHLCWILVLGCLWAPRWGFSGPGRGVLLAQAAGISEDKNCGSFGDESFRDSAADAVAIKQQPAQWWKLQGCSDTGYRCPLPGPDCESCRGLWWLRGLPRPTADGLLRCCGLHRALHRGHGISLPLRPFFSSRCLQLPLLCPSPPWSGWDETAPQAELGEAWEGGSSLCFTFLPVWPVEPSGEGDPLGAELCHPGGQDDAGERKTFFLPVLCGSFLYFSFTVLL